MKSAVSRPFLLTSIGKKYLMALTGFVWVGFVLVHMAGNLLLFVGSDSYNRYSYNLVNSGILIPAEIILLLSFTVHIGLAILLTVENRRARGVRYAVQPRGSKASSLASRTMGAQGSLILCFVILHLITFKYGTYYETVVGGVKMQDLYRLVIEVFHQPGYIVWYIFCLCLLGFHLSHGVGSLFQSLGLKNDRYAGVIRKFSFCYTVLVTVGFLTQPIYVYFTSL